MRVVTFKINDHEVSGRDDETILKVARDHDTDIPTLCQLDGISVWADAGSAWLKSKVIQSS